MSPARLSFSSCLAAAVLVAACGRPAAAPEAPAPPQTAPAQRAQPAWPEGLKPCAKDAPDGGGGCAAGAPKPSSATSAAIGDEKTVWSVPVGPDDPVQGPNDALVTVVVFSDFECPFCKQATATFDRLRVEYPMDVRFVWKDLPLPAHDQAEPAAEVARAVRAAKGDAGFWQAHDRLYAVQASLGEAAYRKIVESFGLSWPSVRASVRAARFGSVIQADVALSDRVDVPATPTTFVNGRKIVGAQPYERLKAVVDEELGRARKGVAAGITPDRTYATIVESGVQLKPPTDAPK